MVATDYQLSPEVNVTLLQDGGIAFAAPSPNARLSQSTVLAVTEMVISVTEGSAHGEESKIK